SEADLGSDGVILARGASAFFLLFHQAVETWNVNFNCLIAEHVLRQIQRKSVGVVESEGDLAGESMSAAFLDAREFRVDSFEAAIERFDKTRFLLRDDLGGLACCVLEFRVRVAHRLDNARVSTREERAMNSNVASVTRGATDKSAQYILAIG